MQSEIWKEIPGYESWYSVSNIGRVRRDRIGYGTYVGKIISPAGQNGYLKTKLSMNGVIKTFSIHRLVALAFIGHRPEGNQINHKDGNRINNHLSNLEYVTPKQNTAHAIKNGLIKFTGGETKKFWNQKLTKEQVLEIREKHKNGTRQAQLYKEYGVCRQTMNDIVLRNIWKNI